MAFEFGVARLRNEPAAEWFAIVVEQPRLQIFDAAVDDNALRVSILHVGRCFTSIQDGHGWINPAVQAFAVDAVNEFRAVTGRMRIRVKVLELGYSIARHSVIGVKREQPRCLDACLAQPKLPLTPMAIKRALKDAHAGKRSGDLERRVVAETIDNDDVARPGERFQRAADIRRFVVSENQRRDLFEH